MSGGMQLSICRYHYASLEIKVVLLTRTHTGVIITVTVKYYLRIDAICFPSLRLAFCLRALTLDVI